jgi:UDP-N-acetylmuramoyl-tripeptide--D-alanyl-D-alanine ligase
VNLRADEVLEDLTAAMPVEATGAGPEATFDGVCTDSRADVAGRLFVALVGDRFDAHDFVQEVVARGVRGVVVRRTAPEGPVPNGCARYRVEDTLAALQAIARGSLRRRRPRVVAITGSNGKTTTKDLAVAALGSRGRVHGTTGNLNNHIGVPLTILSRQGDEDFLVAEAGANDFGELTLLSQLLEPDVVVITNIGRAHLEKFGSQDGVLRAKSELFAALRPDGCAVLPADDGYFKQLVERVPRGVRIASFGHAPESEYRVDSARPVDAASQTVVVRGVRFVLARPGRHNAANAAAALAVAVELGADLRAAAAGLASCRFTGGRSAWMRLGAFEVLDDTYNANPDSMARALDLLDACPGRRIAVLGDMLELGGAADALHAELGRAVAAAGVDLFLGLGAAMEHAVHAARDGGLGDRARHFESLESLVAALRAALRPGDAVLVKGSRGSRMERVVAALAAEVA